MQHVMMGHPVNTDDDEPWESLAAGRQMETLPEMLAQRAVFVELGVKFEPIRNYQGLWSIDG